MSQVQLLEKIKKIPVAYQQEVEDFVDFILEKKVILLKAVKSVP